MAKITCAGCDAMVDTSSIACSACGTPIGYHSTTTILKQGQAEANASPKRQVVIADPTPTFRERFADIFQALEDHGFKPQWQPLSERSNWHPHPKRIGSNREEVIRCASGPITAVDLRIKTVKDDFEDGSDAHRIETEVFFLLRARWGRRWLPGLHLFSIQLVRYGGWTGNDIGLGIIDQLNGLPHSGRPPQATKIRVTDYNSVDRMDLHTVAGHQIEIVHPSGSTKKYGYSKDEAVPEPPWDIPPADSVQGLIAAAQLVVADPTYLPSRTQSPEVSTVSAPRLSYRWWAGYPIVAAALLSGAVASFFWALSARDWGWGALLGIVLSIICIRVLYLGLARLEEIKLGCTRLIGTLDRKWASPSHHFIRVEGLPFVVKDVRHRALSEGDDVIVTYWPEDKRIQAVERVPAPDA